METKGINFDTGFLNKGTSTREPFDPDVVRREMQIIRDDLHCTAVRITGGDPDRLEIAARHGADAGLEVWFCPFTNGLTQDEVRARVGEFLQRALQLVRERFSGPVSYASLPFEGVDWSQFDIIATDAGYRNATTRASYRECMRAYVERGRALGKPVAITEFGCAPYRGAG